MVASRRQPRTVLLADALDERVLRAARHLKDERLAEPVLVGSTVEIREFAASRHINLSGIKVRTPQHDPQWERLVTEFFNKNKQRGITRREAGESMRNPLFYTASALQHGRGQLAVAGSLSSTADVLRAGLRVIGVAEDIKTVSSFFMMISPQDRVLAFADCAVVPRPDVQQLADIAIATAGNFKRLTGETPRVAMLSFSSHGSADHPLAELVRTASNLVRERRPGLVVDGELQFDAAMAPQVARQKTPDSPLQGAANVFVFPSLNAGNIGYKLAQRLAGYEAIGPFVQGLAKPWFDLSRGCSTGDIINTVIVGSQLV